ncbi:MAG: phosphatase PAP2 family protein [Pyrinomonadaceae bacterium]|nr:phosphatase PAP2 family protein [Pyrinomonadaceae bacterium]
MIDGLAMSALFAEVVGQLTALNDQIFSHVNGLAGRSWLFDNLVALSQENDLIKAGIIGCCFFAAWFSGKTADEIRAHRKTLMITLVAAVCVLAATKVISRSVPLPRPVIKSQKIYHLTGDDLVEMNRTHVRVPLDETSQKEHRDLLKGDVNTNDLKSFPSDHAGFFLAISLGIFFASRRIGALALVWTVLVILGGKLITGAHTPLDIGASAAIAVSVLMIFRFAARSRLGHLLDKVSSLTLRHSALSSAILFAVVFEIASTLFHVRHFLALLVAARRYLMFG